MPVTTLVVLGGFLTLLSTFLYRLRRPTALSFLIFMVGISIFLYGAVSLADGLHVSPSLSLPTL